MKIAVKICHWVGSLKITSIHHYCEKFLQSVSCTWGRAQLSRDGCPWTLEACTCRFRPQAQAQWAQPPFCKNEDLLFYRNTWGREGDLNEINKTYTPLRLGKLPELFGRPGRNKHSLPKCSFPTLGTSTLSDYPRWFIYSSRLLTWSLNFRPRNRCTSCSYFVWRNHWLLLCYFLWLLKLTISI